MRGQSRVFEALVFKRRIGAVRSSFKYDLPKPYNIYSRAHECRSDQDFDFDADADADC